MVTISPAANHNNAKVFLWMRHYAPIYLGILIFLIAFGLRLIAIDWGLPNEQRHQSLHPDELPTAVPAITQPYFKPGFYHYGTLYLTLLKLASDAGTTYGWIKQGDTVPEWKTLHGIHLSGRVISAIAGAVTALLTFLILMKVSNLLGAIMAAIIVTFAPAFVMHSRFQTVDALFTCLCTLSLLCCVAILLKPSHHNLKWVVTCGLTIGLAAGTKYSGAILLPVGWMTCVLIDRSSWQKNSLFLTVAFMVGFLIATPGIILESHAFFRDLTYEFRHVAEGHGLVFVNTPSGFIYHSVVNLPIAIGGIGVLVVGLVGLIWACRDKEKWIWPIITFAILYFILIGRAEVKFLRYVFPLLPVFAIGVGYLVYKLDISNSNIKFVNLLIFILVGFSVSGRNGAFAITQLMQLEDTRDQAAKWMLDNNKDSKTVGIHTDPWFYTPPLFHDTGLLGANRRMEAMRQQAPYMVRAATADGKRIDWDISLIQDYQPEYIIISSFEFVDFDRINDRNFVDTLDKMLETYRLEAIFYGDHVYYSKNENEKFSIDRQSLRGSMSVHFPPIHDLMYVQPTICIFKKKQTP